MNRLLPLRFFLLCIFFSHFYLSASPFSVSQLLGESLADWTYARYDLARKKLQQAEVFLIHANTDDKEVKKLRLQLLAQRVDLHVWLAEFDQAEEYVKLGEELENDAEGNLALAHFREASAGYYFERYNALKRARIMLFSALYIKQQALGVELEHPEILKTRTLLAINYHKGYKSPQGIDGLISKRISEENIAMYEKNHWEQELWYGQSLRIYGIAHSFFKQSYDPKKAICLLRKQQVVDIGKYGKWHPVVGQIFHNLANTHHQTINYGDESMVASYQKAIGFAQTSKEIRTRTLGKKHYYTAFTDWLIHHGHYKINRIIYQKTFATYKHLLAPPILAGLNAFLPDSLELTNIEQVPQFEELNVASYPRYLSLIIRNQSDYILNLLQEEKRAKKVIELLGSVERLAVLVRKLASLSIRMLFSIMKKMPYQIIIAFSHSQQTLSIRFQKVLGNELLS